MPFGITTMLLGDSITVGFPPIGGPGYRKLAAEALPSHVFVGSQVTDASGLHHEGYGGFTVGRLKDVLLGSPTSKGALSLFDPLQLVILAGTNDLHLSSAADIVDQIHVIVRNAQTQSLALQVFVLELPKANGFQKKVDQVNALLREQVPTWVSSPGHMPAELVSLAELNEAYDAEGWQSVLDDGTHPNARGYAMIARAVVHALGGDANSIAIPGGPAKTKPVGAGGGHRWEEGIFGETIVTSPAGEATTPVLVGADDKIFHAQVLRWAPLARDAQSKTGVPAAWTLGVIFAESHGDPNAKNSETPPGLGLMQITDPSLKGSLTDAQVMDPATNVAIGARFLSFIRAHGVHDLPSAASIYNCGARSTPPFGAKTSSADPHWGLCNAPHYIDRVVGAANTYALEQAAAGGGGAKSGGAGGSGGVVAAVLAVAGVATVAYVAMR